METTATTSACGAPANEPLALVARSIGVDPTTKRSCCGAAGVAACNKQRAAMAKATTQRTGRRAAIFWQSTA
eukprot:CAMPEP_0185904908 /NCGR_PEP_ID=MMETSP0196C-20130402/4183_1 /TAXON_ID=2932 /ORGANISM="Alexandrium fundyense, Strain CCMP1719" /LENGTH=71 /DNA_ID=CAMNT_0028624323 /DNA_START=159 /DNA_END=371 /DNA_ORIENTATION=-